MAKAPDWLVELERNHQRDTRPGFITPGGNPSCICGAIIWPGDSHLADVMWTEVNKRYILCEEVDFDDDFDW